MSWLFYPIVFLFPLIGLTGGAAIVAVEVGYTIADIVAKAVFGLLILAIAIRKSENETGERFAVPGTGTCQRTEPVRRIAKTAK